MTLYSCIVPFPPLHMNTITFHSAFQWDYVSFSEDFYQPFSNGQIRFRVLLCLHRPVCLSALPIDSNLLQDLLVSSILNVNHSSWIGRFTGTALLIGSAAFFIRERLEGEMTSGGVPEQVVINYFFSSSTPPRPTHTCVHNP